MTTHTVTPERSDPAGEPELGPSHEGSVVLDIGGHTGAAVVYTPEGLAGQELEITPDGEPWAGTHTGVRPRERPDGVCFAAVFGSLPAGRYLLRVRGSGSEPDMGLTVDGGTVIEARWPGS